MNLKNLAEKLKGNKRLTIQCSDRLTTLLEKLAKKANTDRIDIIRSAFALYSYLDEELGGTKKKLAIISEDGKIEKIIDLS
jgi:transcriptional regulator